MDLSQIMLYLLQDGCKYCGLGPKAMIDVDFTPWLLNSKVSGPSGYHDSTATMSKLI